MKTLRDLKMPKLRANARVLPATLDADARTLEVLFYTGAEVLRVPYFDEPYLLSFDLSPKAARLDRYNAGAPIVDNHHGGGSVGQVVLGVIEKAWMAADGGHAKVRFSSRDGVTDLFNDIKDGIIRNFSMGAVIHQMKDVTEKGDKMRRLLAIDWEPMELSVVPVPADVGAQALAAEGESLFPFTLLGAGAPLKENRMKIKVRLLATGEVVEIDEQAFDEKLHSMDLTAPTPPAPRGTTLTEARRIVDEAIAEDEAYAAEVQRLGRHFGRDENWIERQVRLGTPISEVKKLASKARADEAPRPKGVVLGEERESLPWRRDRMAEALAARASGVACPEPARQYARHSFADMALEILEASGQVPRGHALSARHDAYDIIRLGLHTSSDFPLMLANALNKNLLQAYDQAPATYRRISAPRTFKDFRPHKFQRVGDFPVPVQVGESGEYQYGTLGESQESITLLKYGRILALALEALINDDIGAFNDLSTLAARRAVDFENTTFFNICILPNSGTGPAMRDTVVVYHSTHANVGAAGALSLTLLSDIRAKMMAQTSIDGLKLNLVPRILLVPPGSLTLAEQLTMPSSTFTGGSTTVATVNPFAGRLEALGDANLSGTRLYALADPGAAPQYVAGGLAGQSGPRTEVRNGFNVDGVEFKLTIFFGCGAIDYRAGVSAAGA